MPDPGGSRGAAAAGAGAAGRADNRIARTSTSSARSRPTLAPAKRPAVDNSGVLLLFRFCVHGIWGKCDRGHNLLAIADFSYL